MKSGAATAALFLSAVALQGQIGQLATSGDGGILLFRSTFRLTTETTLGSQAKIYSWRNGLWTNLATAPVPGANREPPDVFSPFISRTGDVFGWQVDPGCFTCVFRYGPYFYSDLSGAVLPPLFPGGSLQISSNSRYFTGDGFPESGPQYFDSLTGAVTNVPIQTNIRVAIRGIADDGTVLLFQGSSNDGLPSGPLSLWKPGSVPRVIQDAVIPLSAAISATGERVAAEELSSQPAQGGTRSLVVLEAATGTRLLSFPLSSPSTANAYTSIAQPAWDAAGSVVIFRNFSSETSNYVLQSWSLSDGNTPRTILSHPEGIANVTISGDGNVVWAVTASNRLLRLNRSTGQVDEILPALPTAGTSFSDGVAGSAYFITGTGFSADVIASDNGVPLQVLEVRPEGFFVQIPWDAAPGVHQIGVRSSPGNPFEAVTNVSVYDRPVPNILTLTPQSHDIGYAVVAHEDFTSFVSAQSPARAGEIIHVYLTGLGPVDAALHPTIPFACTLAYTDAAVSSVSYTPETVGFYRADLVVPGNVPAGESPLFCKVTGADFLFSSTATISTAP